VGGNNPFSFQGTVFYSKMKKNEKKKLFDSTFFLPSFYPISIKLNQKTDPPCASDKSWRAKE
jgi:hypothetical protein